MREPITPHFGLRDGLRADAFERDRNYRNRRPRGTNDWLLIYTLAGGGEAGTGGPLFPQDPGSVLLYLPGTPQEYHTAAGARRWNLLWAHFLPRESWGMWLHWPEVAPGLLALRLRDRIARKAVEQALRDCVWFFRNTLPGSGDLARNALERAILWINSTNTRRALDDRVRKAVSLLVRDLALPFSLENLARDCGLSGSRLAHLFREQLGVPPRRYLEEVRMERAAALLRGTTLPVAEIAAETGYPEPFYFTNRFRAKFGRSPSAFRRTT